MSVPEVGPAGSLLGSTLVKCPGGGFVAGAPGTGTAWHSPSISTPPAVGEGLGRAIACIGNTGSEMLAGGDGGVRKAVFNTWSSPLGVGIVLSMSSAEDPQLPLLLGYNAAVAFANAGTGTQTGPMLNGSNGYGAVVLWFPGEPRFAVTHAVGSRVVIYDYDTAGSGSVSEVEAIQNNVQGFGQALAVGDVLPSPGNELIIGAAGAVFVYLHDGSGPVMRLTGTDSSFGTSVTTAPHGLGIDQLFVGQPLSNSVYQFLGDAGDVVKISTNIERFGASLAASGGQLAIGAPDHSSGSGAVYTELIMLGAPSGAVQECEVGRACLDQQCNAGVCVGGVFCDTSLLVPGCDVLEVCVSGRCVDPNDPDAGTPRPDASVIIDDGGVVLLPDASIDLDAGTPDAGMPDASVSVDAGSAFDASVPIDAGSVDSGVVDPADSGTPMPDAGRDAGVEERDGGMKPSSDAGSDQVGTMIFTTSGCSESAALPVLALCLAWLRRRAR
jgi:hypothetical protein